MSDRTTLWDAITAPPAYKPTRRPLRAVPREIVDPGASEAVQEPPGGPVAARTEPPRGGARRDGSEGDSYLIHRQKDAGDCKGDTYGEIASEGGEQTLARRVERYAKARSQALKVCEWLGSQIGAHLADYRHSSDLDRIKWAHKRLMECGSWLEFRQYLTLEGLPTRLHRASFCRQPKLCAFCAIRRATKLLRAYLPKVLTLVSGGRRVNFVTFTAKNGSDLKDRYRKIDGALRRLMDQGRRARAGALQSHAWSSIEGAVFSYEFKRGRDSGLWHPHIHGLIFTPGQVTPHESVAIRRAWCEATGESDLRAQDIRGLITLPHGLGLECLSESELFGGVGKDLVEVFKYPLKFAGMEPADTWAAAVAVRGCHLIRPFGAMRGVEISERWADEPLDHKDLPYLRLLLSFDSQEKRYSLRERAFFDDFEKKGYEGV